MAARAEIEKPCPAFTGQTAGQISTKLHRSDLYQLKLFMLPALSTSLHKMAATAKNREKNFVGFQTTFTGVISLIILVVQKLVWPSQVEKNPNFCLD